MGGGSCTRAESSRETSRCSAPGRVGNLAPSRRRRERRRRSRVLGHEVPDGIDTIYENVGASRFPLLENIPTLFPQMFTGRAAGKTIAKIA